MGAQGRLGDPRRSKDGEGQEETTGSAPSEAQADAREHHDQRDEGQDPDAEPEREVVLGRGAGRAVNHVSHPDRQGHQQQERYQQERQEHLHLLKITRARIQVGSSLSANARPSCRVYVRHADRISLVTALLRHLEARMAFEFERRVLDAESFVSSGAVSHQDVSHLRRATVGAKREARISDHAMASRFNMLTTSMPLEST